MTRLSVNGREVELDPDVPLVLTLRNDLGLRGVRPGCAIGECGSCVVLADGRPVRSCRTTAAEVAGSAVTTPEGLGTPEAPHPVQRAFLEEQAAQCGYCVNGMTMSVAALLDANPAPGEDQIRETLDGHLCRCGTHHRILRAARRLAGRSVPPCREVRRQPATGPDTTPGPVEPPRALREAPNVEHWLRPQPDGTIEVRSGRVELGQGIRTAFAQVVAAELELPLDRFVVGSAATDLTPDEGYTAGSMSLEQGGAALARAAAAYRRLTEAGLPPTGPILPDDLPKADRAGPAATVPRTDLPAKLTGAPAFVHDLAFPGMLHARALLPPTYDARPAALDLAAARAMAGVEAVVHDDGLVVVIARREEQAIRAAERLRESAAWRDRSASPPPSPAGQRSRRSGAPDLEPAAWLREAPATPFPVVDDEGTEAALATGPRVTASYAKPYEAHGSVAPSCAVAYSGEDTTQVWTHCQGVFPLRRELAALLGEDERHMIVRHADGPGCYGHNGADDAAGFAVLAARAVPGRHVRFQFSVQDELGWEPYGPPMLAHLAASLGDDGRIQGWRHVVRTDAHTSRPHGSGDRLVVSWLRKNGVPRPWAGTGEGGVRSAVPIYDIPAREVLGEYVQGPLRTSALRSLGAYLNLFAIESFVDELAAATGRDPVEFRLAHLSDDRARAVLIAACEAAGRKPPRHGDPGQGFGEQGFSGEGVHGQGVHGQGVAVARYKGSKAYVAQVVDVDADPESGGIAVRRVVTACDAGAVVNSDGLVNQLEGGTLQGLSRALHEEVRARPDGERALDWRDYPCLRFTEVPDLHTVVLDRPGHPPLGAGEASTPVTPAALANAVADATGLRVRQLPLTPERLRSAASLQAGR